MNEHTDGESCVINEVTKKCADLAHDDLLKALEGLIPHMVKICDFRGSDLVDRDSIDNIDGILESLRTLNCDYEITGFSIGGADDKEGVTLIGCRVFESGKVLNIVTPFTQYQDEDYKLGSELADAIERCVFETYEYLFNGKVAYKQLEMDFNDESPEEGDSAMKLTAKIEKKINKKLKKVAEEAAA